MTVAKDALRQGLVLVATYKHNTYACTTYEDNGKIRFRLEDGRDFKSISGAAGAITGIPTQNGWAFWSIASSGASGATESHETNVRVVDPTIKINGRIERPGGAIKSKTIVKERKVKRVNTRKPKDWVTIEDEYIRAAEQVMAMSMGTVATSAPEDVEYVKEGDYSVRCMECGKVFPDSLKASSHFNKKH